MRKPKKTVQWRLAFFLIILIALTARFTGLDVNSFSLHEVNNVELAQSTFKEHLSTFSFATSQSSPLFILLLHIWSELFGESEFALRSLAVAISILTFFPFFGIARILFNKGIAYTSLALYALSPLAISIAQTISPLTLFILFSLMSTWALLMTVRRRHLEYRIFYILTAFGALFTHSAFWYLLIFQHITIYIAFFHKEARHLTLKKWIMLEALLIIVILITMPDTIPVISLPFNRGWATPLLGYGNFLLTLSGSILLLVLFMAILYQLFLNSRRYHIVFHNFTPKILYLTIWTVVVTVFPFMFSFDDGDFGRANGAVAGIVPFLLLIASGIDTIESKKRRKILVIILIISSAVTLRMNYSAPSQISFKDIMTSLKEKDPKAGIILVNSEYEPLLSYYGSSAQVNRYISVSKDLFSSTRWQQEVDHIADTSIALHLILVQPEEEVNFLFNHLSDEFAITFDTLYRMQTGYNREVTDLRVANLKRHE